MRKNVERILAMGLTGVLISTLLVGSMEYATHSFSVDAKAAQKVTQEPMGTKETSIPDEDGISKQETVYVNLNAAGKTKDIVVSDWLKNSGKNGMIEDVSDLTDIENVKGDEKFEQDGDCLIWHTEDEDIYYQGKTQKQLPVGMKISYRLNGQKIAPRDLGGKSGRLEMVIEYSNTSCKEVTLAGKKAKIYTPFVMVTGMILPVDHFQNVSIDNGTIVSEGDNDIVVGYGFPGLSESLALEDLDFGKNMDIDTSKIRDKITDTVTIRADVTDLEMKPTYTVATNHVFQELDLDEIEDVGELSDKMDELTDASSQLMDGADKLKNGTQELKDSFGEYADAIRKARDGASDLKKGAGTLNDGVKDYTKGADQLLDGVNTYVEGTKTLSKGIQSYTEGASKLVDAVDRLRTGTADLPDQYETLSNGINTYVSAVNQLLAKDNMNQLTSGTKDLKEGIGQLDDGLKAAQGGVSKMNEAASALKGSDKLDQCVAGLTALKDQYQAAADDGDGEAAQLAEALQGAISYIEGGQEAAAVLEAATNGKGDGDLDNSGSSDIAAALGKLQAATDKSSSDKNLYTGAAALEKASDTMSGAASKLRDSSKELKDGNAKMKAGIAQLSDSIGQIDSAGGTLTDNNEELNDGASQLIQNSSEITKNAKKIKRRSGDLRDGARKLEKGTGTLFDGMQKLVEATGQVSDGVSDLNDGASDLKGGMMEFKRKGIDEVADVVTNLLDTSGDLNDRLSRISSQCDAYTSFSGSLDTMDSSVKFIMSTEETGA